MDISNWTSNNTRDLELLINCLSEYHDERIALLSFACQTENYDINDSYFQQYPKFLHNIQHKKRVFLIDPNFWEEFLIVPTLYKTGLKLGTPTFIANLTTDNGTIIPQYNVNTELQLKNGWTRFKSCSRISYENKGQNVIIQCFQTAVHNIINFKATGFDFTDIDLQKGNLNEKFNKLLNAMHNYIKLIGTKNGIIIFHFPWLCMTQYVIDEYINKYTNVYTTCNEPINTKKLIIYSMNSTDEENNIISKMVIDKLEMKGGSYFNKYLKYKKKYDEIKKLKL